MMPNGKEDGTEAEIVTWVVMSGLDKANVRVEHKLQRRRDSKDHARLPSSLRGQGFP